MNDSVEQNTEMLSNQLTISDGAIPDFDLLTKDLMMSPKSEGNPNDDIHIELGSLEFDYSQVKQEVSEGKSKLRLIKDGKGNVLGFTVISQGKQSSVI